jgi:hypothetical protein
MAVKVIIKAARPKAKKRLAKPGERIKDPFFLYHLEGDNATYTRDNE